MVYKKGVQGTVSQTSWADSYRLNYVLPKHQIKFPFQIHLRDVKKQKSKAKQTKKKPQTNEIRLRRLLMFLSTLTLSSSPVIIMSLSSGQPDVAALLSSHPLLYGLSHCLSSESRAVLGNVASRAASYQSWGRCVCTHIHNSGLHREGAPFTHDSTSIM